MPEGDIDAAPATTNSPIASTRPDHTSNANGTTQPDEPLTTNGTHDENDTSIKQEGHIENGDGIVTNTPVNGKKRKFDAITKSGRGSRGVSPPWKKAGVEGPSSIIVDGKRKSARQSIVGLSSDAATSESDVKPKFEKAPWKKAHHDGPTSVVVDGKRKSTRGSVAEASPDKPVKVSPPWKKVGVDGPTSKLVDGKRVSTRRHTLPAALQSPSDNVKKSKKVDVKQRQSEVGLKGTGHNQDNKKARKLAVDDEESDDVIAAKKKVGRPPGQRSSGYGSINGQTLSNGKLKMPNNKHKRSSSRLSLETPDLLTNGARRSNGANESVSPTATRTPRLKLRIKLDKLPHGNPLHYARPAQFESFSVWTEQDDPFEGDASGCMTDKQERHEAQRRLRVVKASEPGGALSAERCSRFTNGDWQEPRPRFGHSSYLAAHAVNFRKLMMIERDRHMKTAKALAHDCERAIATQDRWKALREAKTAEQIWAEELKYQGLRARQVVRDIDARWSLVGAEVHRIRLKEWEQQQEALGRKAMDEMLQQSEAVLRRNPFSTGLNDDNDTNPYEVQSDDEQSEDETLGFGENSDSEADNTARSEDENMTESSEEDEEEEADAQAGAPDDDATLSPEALRKKYAELFIQERTESSSDEEDQEASDVDIDDKASDADSLQSPASRTLRDPEAPVFDQSADERDAGTTAAEKSDGEDDDNEEPDEETEVEIDQLENYQPPELDEVDAALLDSDEDASTDMDSDLGSDDEEGWDSGDSGSEASEDDTAGTLGFFFSKKELEQVVETDDQNVESAEVSGMKPAAEPAKTAGVERDLPNGTSHDHEDDANTEDAATSPQSMDISSNADEQRQHSTTQSTPQTPRSETFSHTSSHALQKVDVPSQLLRGTLREYQHDGLDWLAKLYVGGRNGILADEMGLGKTIQTISLLAHVALQHENWGPHLVVVPTSVMLNWEMEFKKWCPGFKILTYYGTQEERKRKRQGWLEDNKWNVCITSYQLILQDAAAFKKRAWHYLILDEAHNIKNFQTQRWQTMLTFRTHSRLLLTGTPLQNNLQELWSLLYFLMPAGTDGAGGFADLEKFLNSLKKPADQILDQGRQKLDAEAQARVNKLHEVLRPYLLRRLKSEVEKQMPGKYEHVIYCRLSKRQRQLYDEFMGRADTKQTLSSGNYMSIINCLMSLRKVCNHPDLFETRQIVTSFAMTKSAVIGYEAKERLVRTRLLTHRPIDLDFCGLVPRSYEGDSRSRATRVYELAPTTQVNRLLLKQRQITEDLTAEQSDDDLRRSSTQLTAQQDVLESLRNCAQHIRRTSQRWPIYGKDLVELLTVSRGKSYKISQKGKHTILPSAGDLYLEQHQLLASMMPSLPTVVDRCKPLIQKFTCVTPAVVAEDVLPLALTRQGQQLISQLTPPPYQQTIDPYHEARIRHSIQFPDKRLLQYDCGKLQALAKLLRQLQAGGHRCLIFTQMTKVLDILEQFLNIHGHKYLRLDGATKIEQRQILTDRFNSDKRILAFILSSRSGGLGINLTGADTVIFYDLDWNPAMDAQCQDRCHRIGQTRDVHIYRLVSEFTIEANILRKSNQKRLLDDVIIQKGDFTTDTFKRITAKDAFVDEDQEARGDNEAGQAMDRILGGDAGGLGKVFESAEDKEDTMAAKVAAKEMTAVDVADFDESAKTNTVGEALPEGDAITSLDEVMADAKERIDEEMPHIDEYMVKFLLRELAGVPIVLPNTANARKNLRRARDRGRKR